MAATPQTTSQTTPQTAPIVLGEMSKHGQEQHTWCNLDASTFNVRGSTYDTDHVKVPSAEAFYNCTSMDFFMSPTKPSWLYPHCKLPALPQDILEKVPDLPIPAQILVVLPFPRYCPSMMGPPNDGESTTFVISLQVTQNTIQECSQPPHLYSNALKLFLEFAENPQRLMKQFKFIHRLEEQNFAEAIKEYSSWSTSWMQMLLGFNGKPVLCREDISCNRFNDGQVLEIRFDYHVGAYIPRYALYYFRDLMNKFIIEIGILVEGRGGENQPEQLIAAWRSFRPRLDLARQVQWPPESAASAF
eukprot:c384_g1_i2.p1 GENE.c384_g1_i2~~c384_g1_i2.p1  ORF type:complete len:334 (+),score=83.32 c384_g1_i2:97-1002(+)